MCIKQIAISKSTGGIFQRYQPKYAAAGIATFPVRIEGKD
jgi:hypothetical protein